MQLNSYMTIRGQLWEHNMEDEEHGGGRSIVSEAGGRYSLVLFGGKSMCAFGILKSRAHTLGTHTATLFILETHRDKLFTMILAPYPVSSWSNQLMDLATSLADRSPHLSV